MHTSQMAEQLRMNPRQNPVPDANTQTTSTLEPYNYDIIDTQRYISQSIERRRVDERTLLDQRNRPNGQHQQAARARRDPSFAEYLGDNTECSICQERFPAPG